MIEIYKGTIRKALSLPIHLPRTENITHVVAKKYYPCGTKPYTIRTFVENKEVEISRGYVLFDESLNSLEIIYPYSIELSLSDVRFASLESFINPITYIPIEVVASMSLDYFTPSAQLMPKLLEKCFELDS
jgi:hypothetical protein